MLKLLFIVNLYKENTIYVIVEEQSGETGSGKSNRTNKNSGNFFIIIILILTIFFIRFDEDEDADAPGGSIGMLV